MFQSKVLNTCINFLMLVTGWENYKIIDNYDVLLDSRRNSKNLNHSEIKILAGKYAAV